MLQQLRLLQVNFFGCYNVAKLLVPGMLERNSGHLCFISSMVFVSPMVGYTSYAASKGAVRLFADCLRSEMQGTGVTVSIGYPPDTATPGYDRENESKPEETLEISRVVQDHVYTAEQVAGALFRGLKVGKYHLPNVDFLHQLGLSLTAGMTPRPLWLVLEMLLAPLLVLVGAIMCGIQDYTVRKVGRRQREAQAGGTRSNIQAKVC